RADGVLPVSLGRTVQDALQRDRPVQPGGGNMASFGNPSALSFFPVTATEEPVRFQAGSVDLVETARVDGDPVGLRARHVERVHAAMRAEGVLCHAGAEGVGGQRVLAAQQFEMLRLDRQMEDALLRANRAVALRQQVQIDLRAEAYPAAMAAALTSFQHCSHSPEPAFPTT